ATSGSATRAAFPSAVGERGPGQVAGEPVDGRDATRTCRTSAHSSAHRPYATTLVPHARPSSREVTLRTPPQMGASSHLRTIVAVVASKHIDRARPFRSVPKRLAS